MEKINSYQKLEEAQSVFLNPTLKDIENHHVPLEHVCYFRIKRYPKRTDPIWDLLEKATNSNVKQTPTLTHKNKELDHNLQLAIQKKDWDYFEYLLSHRPGQKAKGTLTFRKKHCIVPEDVLKALIPTQPEPKSEEQTGQTQQTEEQEPRSLDRIELKCRMHNYIKTHKLQKSNQVQLDDLLIKLLDLDPQTYKVDQTVHYLELFKLFRGKYHPHNLQL